MDTREECRQNETTFKPNLISKPRLIHYGFGKEQILKDKIQYCLHNNWVLVFITPAVKEFHPEISSGLRILGENLWVYEMNMAMETVMSKRAWDYFCNYQNSYFSPPAQIDEFSQKDLVCCYVETNPTPIEERLFKSASVFGTYPIAIGKGEQWDGFSTKLKLYKEFLKTRSEKFVLGTDSRDVLYFDSGSNILNRFLTSYYTRGHKVVFNSETNCYPNGALADKHPCQSKKYKYLNSGCFIGEREYFIEILNRCEEYSKKKKVVNKQDDQELIQHIFIDNIKNRDASIWLDYDCNIFQVLWDEHGGRSANFDLIYGRNYIYDQYTNTMPQIFHFPGPTGHGETIWKILNKKFNV